MTDHNICLAMIEHIEDYAILYLDCAGNIQNWHKGAEKLHGYTTAEGLGKNFSIFYTDADKESGMLENILREATEKGRYQNEGWKVRKDGTRYWGNTIITAHYDDQNNVTGFTKITHDLTDKRRLQEKLGELNKQLKQKVRSRDRELAQSVEKYKLLFAANPLPMWLFDLETFHFLDVNDIACSHYGYSRQEFLSMSVLDIRTDEQKILFIKAEHPSKLPAQEYNRGIWQHVKKDGTRIDVEIFGHDIVYKGKKARIVIINDITKRKSAEEKLKHNEIRLKQAQQMAHFGHWELDFSSGIATWSEEACRIYGLAVTDNKQSYERWQSFIHPEDFNYVMDQIAKGRKTFSPTELYHRILLRDGTIKYLCSQSHFEFNGNGRPIGMYGVAHDVTEQKIAEEKIINANRLYSFISGINQLIVHIDNEGELFDETCRIATTIGRFNLAWIGEVDDPNQTLRLLAHCNADQDDLEVITDLAYDIEGPVATVLKTGSYFAVNDVTVSTAADTKVGRFVSQKNFGSFIVLPIKKSGVVYATLSLFSHKQNLFDSAEIALLEEVAGDISFALAVFEKKLKAEQAEKRIQHSQLRLNQAQSIAHVGSWELDFAVGVAVWSDEHCRIYGLETENNKHTFESWLSFIHPEERNFVSATIQGTEHTFESASFHHRILRRDGSIRHIYMHSQYELDDTGIPVGLYGVSHDVTESKEAQNSLVQSEANLRLIMDLIPQRIFVKDFSGKYQFVNKSFADLYSLGPNEFINTSNLAKVFISEHASTFETDDLEVIESGQTKIIPEQKFTGPSGEEKIFHVTKLPYVWGRTREKSVLGILNEITEQKRAEEERNKLLDDILQRNENLEQFTYIISHNLRAPVANIIGLTDLLQVIEDQEEGKGLLEDLAVSVKKLDEVIKDLNNILQIKHRANENKEKIKLSALCEDVTAGIEKLFRVEDVTITTDFGPVDELHALKIYLYSIFFNLISNSFKYRRPNVPLKLAIRSELKNDKVELTFEDNGLGMDLHQIGNQIFGLYKRFHSHIDGKGMGLFMVKSHVEIMGGKIFIESEVNKGTTVRIVFNDY